MAENTIVIEFEPCEPAPADGFKIFYRPLGDVGAYREAPENFTTSPAEWIDTLDAFGTIYEGYIQGDCGGGKLGPAVTFVTDGGGSSSGSGGSGSGSGSEGPCMAAFDWDFTEISAPGTLTILKNGVVVVSESSNSSGTFFAEDGDTISIMVNGTADNLRSLDVFDGMSGILFSDAQQTNLSFEFTANCADGPYSISGTVEAV